MDALRVHAVDRLFCVPGESYLDVLDALHDTPQIDVVVAKHEGAAANMAEADGKLTGRPGICFVTRGPGATHASVGVHTASQDSTPMILFIGQVPRSVRDRDAFQEVDYRQMFGGLAKWTAEMDSADRIPEYVLHAFQLATSGRPGPVVLALPEDVLRAVSKAPDTLPYTRITRAPSAEEIAVIASELDAASRPVLIVGGPCWTDAGCRAVARFAQGQHLPVLASFRRQDLIDNRLPCYAGHLTVGFPPHLQRRIRDADVIIALGTRLGDITTLTYSVVAPPRTHARLIHIHSDSAELNRVFQADVAIAASPDLTALRLASLPPNPARHWKQWTESARREHEAFIRPSTRAAPADGVEMATVISTLSRLLPSNAIITNGAGNFTIWVHRFYTYKEPHTELAPISGAMGYGLPAAVAAALRYRDRPVVCVAGDGDFLMYPQELTTAVQHHARVVVLIVNNGMYGTIRMHQERRFPGRPVATDLPSPDFIGLARSFGAYAECVGRADTFEGAFERAMSQAGPAVLDLRVDRMRFTPDWPVSG